MDIPIIYKDEHIVVVNKPIGLAVHKNKHMAHDAPYLTKILGDQLGCWVYNVHRLDAKTSGVMVLALSTEVAKNISKQFENKTVAKTYCALVKGNPGKGTYDKQVVDRKKKGKRVDAHTDFETLDTITSIYSSKGIDNVEISLVLMRPTTGRWHQLRQHFAQQRCDIIGDTQHGDWTLNRLVTEQTEVHRLCLHASKIAFKHPQTEEEISFEVPTPIAFTTIWFESKYLK